MKSCKESPTPMEVEYQFDNNGLLSNVPYREVIRSTMYLTRTSRPDFIFLVYYLSRIVDQLTAQAWKASKRMLRYIKRAMDTALIYDKRDDETLKGYFDADWTGDHTDGKSVSGTVIFFAGKPVLSSSKNADITTKLLCKDFVELKKHINLI